MRCRLACLVLLCVSAVVPAASAGQPGVDDKPVALEAGRTYRTVNGEPVTGRDVLDLVMEQSWSKNLQEFTTHALIEAELQAEKIAIADAEVEAELKAYVERYAKERRLDPAGLTIEKLAQEAGLRGSVAALRRQTRMNLGLLRLVQKEKGAAVAGLAHIWDPGFKQLVQDRVNKLAAQKGLEADPKKLSAGEAVRIGGRGYARDEVRNFLAEELSNLPLLELRRKLDVLTLAKVVQQALQEKKIELAEDDLSFHFSYLCRRKEAETGVDGRTVLARDIQDLGMTPEQFVHDRVFKSDAGITRLAKAPIREKQLREEFAAHPERYRRAENLVAHILIRVFDPDGRPYGPLWQVPGGNNAINQFAARVREERFAAIKPKAEGLLPLAKQDFDSAARKHSEDPLTSPAAGLLGRIGKDMILAGNADNAVRDLAVTLKPGEVAGPVRGAFGWHIVKCLEKQDVTYEEAAERVYLQLIFEAREKLSTTMLQTAKIEDKLQ